MPTERDTEPKTSADFFNVISRAVFSAGLSWAIIDAKWDAFEEVFHHFDVAQVAAMDKHAVDIVLLDERIVRSRSKIEGTIKNARSILEIEGEHGSLQAWLQTFERYEDASKAVNKRFKFLSKTFGAYYFLYIARATFADFPSFETWSEATGEAHPRMRELVERREGRPVGGPTEKLARRRALR